jgi:hypothetical protein
MKVILDVNFESVRLFRATRYWRACEDSHGDVHRLDSGEARGRALEAAQGRKLEFGNHVGVRRRALD